MPKKTDSYEHEVLTAFEKGQLKSVVTKDEMAKLKAAARATRQSSSRPATKRRVP